MEDRKLSRRHFFFGSAAAAVLAGCASKGPKKLSENSKMNCAAIGAGGKGSSDIDGCAHAGENVIALCDVDDERAADTYKRYPNAKRYRDFREMLEKEKSIDAVTIATPDHTHAVAALTAMQLGKHVYVQKPLTHTIFEARTLLEASRKYKVATQMGNQGHAGDGVRRVCEWIWSGLLGQIKEVHIWTNRPIWPQGIERPTAVQPVPATLDWDLWLGPAPDRPYNEAYAPFAWRGWWDFGCGALGDMGCHIVDPANTSLKLGAPTAVECLQNSGMNAESFPKNAVIRYEFPERKTKEAGVLAAVNVYWYDGGLLPKRPDIIPADVKLGDGDNGSMFIGEKGILTCGCYGDAVRMFPDTLMDTGKKVEKSIPRVKGPYKEWLEACRGGKPAGSNFEYSAPFTETVLLGNIAMRLGKRIEWDSKNMKCTNAPEADIFVNKQYRKGWDFKA